MSGAAAAMQAAATSWRNVSQASGDAASAAVVASTLVAIMVGKKRMAETSMTRQDEDGRRLRQRRSREHDRGRLAHLDGKMLLEPADETGERRRTEIVHRYDERCLDRLQDLDH